MHGAALGLKDPANWVTLNDLSPAPFNRAFKNPNDQFYNGRSFRTLTLVDLYSRECLALHVDKSIIGEAVARVLDQVGKGKGLPKRIKVDNDPEFISKTPDDGHTSIIFYWITHGQERRQITLLLNLSTVALGKKA